MWSWTTGCSEAGRLVEPVATSRLVGLGQDGIRGLVLRVVSS